MKFLKFDSAEEMYNALIDGPDLYSPTRELYVFHYNEEGAIAYYDIDNGEANKLVKDSKDTGEEWSGLLGPGGYIVDPLDNGEDITPVIRYLEEIYEDLWMTTDDYAMMRDSGVYRTLVFEQISDSRFQDDIAKDIRDRKRKIISLLKDMEGVHVSHDVERQVSFRDGTEQFRCKFYVRKDGRKTTWNDVMAAVNSVHAVPYKFQNWFWGNKEDARLS